MTTYFDYYARSKAPTGEAALKLDALHSLRCSPRLTEGRR